MKISFTDTNIHRMKILKLTVLLFWFCVTLEAQNVGLKFNGFILPVNDGVITTYAIGIENERKQNWKISLYYSKSIKDFTRDDGDRDEIEALSIAIRKYFGIDKPKTRLFIESQFGYGQIKLETNLPETEFFNSKGILLGLGLGPRFNLSKNWSVEGLVLPRYFFNNSSNNLREGFKPKYDNFSLRFEINFIIKIFGK